MSDQTPIDRAAAALLEDMRDRGVALGPAGAARAVFESIDVEELARVIDPVAYHDERVVVRNIALRKAERVKAHLLGSAS